MCVNRILQLTISLAAIVMLLTAACSSPSQDLQGGQWVIFTDQQAKEWRIGAWFLAPGQTAEYWTPAKYDILALEDGVNAFLQANPDRFYSEGAPVWERLDGYNRQYVGIILDDRKIVYANFFCDSVGTDWRKDFVFVLDGGDCYFQFKYDPVSKEFFDLQVNGEA